MYEIKNTSGDIELPLFTSYQCSQYQSILRGSIDNSCYTFSLRGYFSYTSEMPILQKNLRNIPGRFGARNNGKC